MPCALWFVLGWMALIVLLFLWNYGAHMHDTREEDENEHQR